MVTKNKRKKNNDIWFLFDLRGEYHGHVATAFNDKGVLMLKKGDYNKYLLSLGNEVGDPEELRFNYIVKDVDVDVAIFSNLTHEHLDFHNNMEIHTRIVDPNRMESCDPNRMR